MGIVLFYTYKVQIKWCKPFCGSECVVWFKNLCVGYFNHSINNATSWSNMEDHSLYGIAVGRDDNMHTVIFQNALTWNYYDPPASCLGEGRLPITIFPDNVRYDGSLTCGLMCNCTDPIPEPFPPGTRVTITRNNSPVRGTIQNILPVTSDLISTADTACFDSTLLFFLTTTPQLNQHLKISSKLAFPRPIRPL